MANFEKSEGPLPGRESYDPASKKFTTENGYRFGPDVTRTRVILNAARLNIRGTDERNPVLKTRVIVTAESAAQAQEKLREKEGNLDVRRTQAGELIIDGSTELDTSQGFSSDKYNVHIGNISASRVVIGDGITMVNSDIVSSHTTTESSFTREVDLELPRQMGTIYDVEQTSGEIIVNGVVGQGCINSKSADADIIDSGGQLHIRSASGDVAVTRFQGTANVESVSGDLKMKDITLYKNNTIKTVNGDVKVTTNNNSLGVDAITTTGKIKIPDDATEFTGAKQKDIVGISARGYMGTDRSPTNRVQIKTVSGNIKIKKSKPE